MLIYIINDKLFQKQAGIKRGQDGEKRQKCFWKELYRWDVWIRTVKDIAAGELTPIRGQILFLLLVYRAGPNRTHACGNLDSGLEEISLISPFISRSKLVSREDD